VSVIELKDLWEQTVGLSAVHHLGDEEDEGIAHSLDLGVRLMVRFGSIHPFSSSTHQLENNPGMSKRKLRVFRCAVASSMHGVGAELFPILKLGWAVLYLPPIIRARGTAGVMSVHLDSL
jgi:hypothetical protein